MVRTWHDGDTMCGIVGYIGDRESVPILLQGLRRLEYRGYDSAGVAVLHGEGITVRRCAGRLSGLEEELQHAPASGVSGIGHTRWATHGAPSKKNSHPHTDRPQHIAVVHNGIIENYQNLRDELAAQGTTFSSETDTEVLPHLIQQELAKGAEDVLTAIRLALQKAKGAYALGILCIHEPDTLYAARLGSPLIAGIGNGERFIASDVPAILNETKQVIYLEDGQIAVLRKDHIGIFDLDGTPIEPKIRDVNLSSESVEKAGFETYMLKEIHEQPRVLRNLLEKNQRDKSHAVSGVPNFDDQPWKDLQRIMAISCGTAFHAAMYGRLLLEYFTSIPVETDVGSEFRYRHAHIESDTLIVAVSQSGETADTLASVQLAKKSGCKILSICNVPGSSLVRLSDEVIFTEAGPEIGVASTKAYTAQLMAFALLALSIAEARQEITSEKAKDLVKALEQIPNAIHYVIERKQHIKLIADKHHDGPSSLYLGRRFNVPTALEGALKNKEISYQHAEAYAAGEMKHGPIALINEYLPVICICTKTTDDVYEKMISNMREVEARHGRIIAVATDGDSQIQQIAEDVIYVPETCEEFSPMINVVALQLLAYYAAQARGTDIDKPRNLAKCVTVE